MIRKAIALISKNFPDHIVSEAENNTIHFVIPDHCIKSDEAHKILKYLNEIRLTGVAALKLDYRDEAEGESSLMRDVVQALNKDVLGELGQATTNSMRRIELNIKPFETSKNTPDILELIDKLQKHIISEIQKDFPVRDIDLFFDIKYPFKTYPTFNIKKT